ncbi:MAG: GDSL-type esterase/lipase family protein [Acidobacteria bacterium]|nr:GDSL-type esterase/lipase family protein [Acidobacteriota bacterium]
MKNKTTLLKRIFLVIGSLVISLLVAEGITRLFFGGRVVLFPRFHDEASYGKYTIRRLRPDTTFWHRSVDGSWKFVTNSKGFRSDSEYSYSKPTGVLRVISLGDSHTEGFECHQDKTYSSVIQRYLGKRGIKAEVINAGVSGFGTAEALTFLENEGIKYSPDVVVLGYFANDVDDNIKADLFRLDNGTLVENKYDHAPGTKVSSHINRIMPLRWLSQNSYTYSIAFNTMWEWRKRALLTEKEREMATEFAVKQEDNDTNVATLKNDLTIAIINRMHGFCQSNKVLFVLLDIPQLEKNGHDFRSSIPNELVAQFSQGSDAMIRSTNVLMDYRGVTDLFVPHGQRHISETTHMLLGVATAKDIIKHLNLSSSGNVTEEIKHADDSDVAPSLGKD